MLIHGPIPVSHRIRPWYINARKAVAMVPYRYEIELGSGNGLRLDC